MDSADEDLFHGFEHGGRVWRAANVAAALGHEWRRWPMVLRLLTENIIRCADPGDRRRMLEAIRRWRDSRRSSAEVTFRPGRLLMHDTTSTPALVDMAAMRDRVARTGGSPEFLSPSLPVEVSVDHSLAVESYARPDAAALNMKEEVRRNYERYRFLKWAASQMDNLHINPPNTGIMHTINLEQLATVVETDDDAVGGPLIYPDMMLGTDSHTPMINGLGVLGWGIGGLEAETVIFGMPTSLQLPDVVGVRLTGHLTGGATATDLALVVTQRLRAIGATGECVEFFGPGLAGLTVGERAVVANMAPEYGATTGYFPVDPNVVDYLRQTGRSEEHLELVEAYTRAAGFWHEPEVEPEYTRQLEIDLSSITASAAGPQRPQDLLPISQVPQALEAFPPRFAHDDGPELKSSEGSPVPRHPVALASITSCTNTTDPRLLITAGLLARRARKAGVRPKSWVKTSLAPGSPAAVSYLTRAGLTDDLAALGFDIVGFGCATCIGNSGPLSVEMEEIHRSERVRPAAVLSGNRNFPGRVHPDLDIGFLVSPPMVIAYALTGDAGTDLWQVSFGEGSAAVTLRDLWPSPGEVDQTLSRALHPEDFGRDFQVASRNPLWDAIDVPDTAQFPWDADSTILRPPPFAEDVVEDLPESLSAHPLLTLGDDVTTDHISPASAIPKDSFIADFLVERGEDREDLNVFASRRGNWEVMARGAFFNHSLVNGLAPEAPTAHTRHASSGEIVTLWEAAGRYAQQNQPVLVVAGERFGMGSSRDWAAKAQKLLGVRAVLASSFERIHRTNLIGMGILPFIRLDPHHDGLDELVAADRVEIPVRSVLEARDPVVSLSVVSVEGSRREIPVRLAVETVVDRELLVSGGVIPSLMRSFESGSTRSDAALW
ncbi:aconitate hydratase AcnA [Nesterenkonia aerolata]|uniref:Aconitate hydratase AcnA n=1 Tax=Nesterenkonia aerolata TaxID=3074079 RepID=A0ABU2DNC5_9MICC|nr:aconitate hydratase AcnA [Nesterenkonia sp. LY-0111]MDR8018004.1 aconitate hydratase AcnA [Nesterenkonia sp. LY-0111]